MRFSRKRPPNYKDERKVRRFLFWPKTIDYETRWLEFATWHEFYNYDEQMGCFFLGADPVDTREGLITGVSCPERW